MIGCANPLSPSSDLVVPERRTYNKRMLEDVSEAIFPERTRVRVDYRPVVGFSRNALLNFNQPFIPLQGESFTRDKSIDLSERLVPNAITIRTDRTGIATRYTVTLGPFRAAASSLSANSR